MKKVVFVDVDDTILSWQRTCTLSIIETAKYFQISLPADFEAYFHQINDELWKKIESGEMSMEQVFTVRWEKSFSHYDISVNAQEFDRIFLENAKTFAPLVDGAVEMLSYLKSKYRLCAASNSVKGMQQNRTALAGIRCFFDEFYISSEIGYSKPSSEYFDYCLKKEKISGDECVMIGDSLSSDMKGAKNAGMTCIWYDWKNADKKGDYDYRITSLLQVKDIL